MILFLLACWETEPAETPPPTVDASLAFFDFLSETPVVGAEVSASAESATTDEEGAATLAVEEGADFDILVRAERYMDYHFVGRAGAADFSQGLFLPMESTVTTLGAVMGIDPDEERGLLIIDLYDTSREIRADLEGAEVDIDAAYEVSLVANSTAANFEEGNVTLDGERSQVLFANVAVGTATVSVSPPDGYTCAALPGGGATLTAPVYAYALTNLMVGCSK